MRIHAVRRSMAGLLAALFALTALVGSGALFPLRSRAETLEKSFPYDAAAFVDKTGSTPAKVTAETDGIRLSAGGNANGMTVRLKENADEAQDKYGDVSLRFSVKAENVTEAVNKQFLKVALRADSLNSDWGWGNRMQSYDLYLSKDAADAGGNFPLKADLFVTGPDNKRGYLLSAKPEGLFVTKDGVLEELDVEFSVVSEDADARVALRINGVELFDGTVAAKLASVGKIDLPAGFIALQAINADITLTMDPPEPPAVTEKSFPYDADAFVDKAGNPSAKISEEEDGIRLGAGAGDLTVRLRENADEAQDKYGDVSLRFSVKAENITNASNAYFFKVGLRADDLNKNWGWDPRMQSYDLYLAKDAAGQDGSFQLKADLYVTGPDGKRGSLINTKPEGLFVTKDGVLEELDVEFSVVSEGGDARVTLRINDQELFSGTVASRLASVGKIDLPAGFIAMQVSKADVTLTMDPPEQPSILVEKTLSADVNDYVDASGAVSNSTKQDGENVRINGDGDVIVRLQEDKDDDDANKYKDLALSFRFRADNIASKITANNYTAFLKIALRADSIDGKGISYAGPNGRVQSYDLYLMANNINVDGAYPLKAQVYVTRTQDERASLGTFNIPNVFLVPDENGICSVDATDITFQVSGENGDTRVIVKANGAELFNKTVAEAAASLGKTDLPAGYVALQVSGADVTLPAAPKTIDPPDQPDPPSGETVKLILPVKPESYSAADKLTLSGNVMTIASPAGTNASNYFVRGTKARNVELSFKMRGENISSPAAENKWFAQVSVRNQDTGMLLWQKPDSYILEFLNGEGGFVIVRLTCYQGANTILSIHRQTDVAITDGDTADMDVVFSAVSDADGDTCYTVKVNGTVYLEGTTVSLGGSGKLDLASGAVTINTAQADVLLIGPEIGDAHVITANCGDNGVISPIGEVLVNDGEDQTFTITPDAYFEVEEVLVDGRQIALDALTEHEDGTLSYTFENVSGNHTFDVGFKRIEREYPPDTQFIELPADPDAYETLKMVKNSTTELSETDDTMTASGGNLVIGKPEDHTHYVLKNVTAKNTVLSFKMKIEDIEVENFNDWFLQIALRLENPNTYLWKNAGNSAADHCDYYKLEFVLGEEAIKVYWFVVDGETGLSTFAGQNSAAIPLNGDFLEYYTDELEFEISVLSRGDGDTELALVVNGEDIIRNYIGDLEGLPASELAAGSIALDSKMCKLTVIGEGGGTEDPGDISNPGDPSVPGGSSSAPGKDDTPNPGTGAALPLTAAALGAAAGGALAVLRRRRKDV